MILNKTFRLVFIFLFFIFIFSIFIFIVITNLMANVKKAITGKVGL